MKWNGDVVPLDVLVVEDHADTRQVLERILLLRGHRPVLCASAEEALAKLNKRFYPMILLDVQLPGMSGLDLARHLRRQADGDTYYILVATGMSTAADLREILDAGASDYVPKPHEADLLIVRLAIAEKRVVEIASRKGLEYELKFLATRDPLTQLLNRSQLEPALKSAVQAVHDGRDASVLYIDLDNFKVVNDTLGHKAGDRLLVMIADLLKSATRPNDEIVRFGGDEFVVVLTDAALEDAVAIADRLREKMEGAPFLESPMAFPIEASIGVVHVNGLMTPDEILVAADAACYAAKARGRNRVEIYTEMQTEIAQLISQSDWASRVHEGMRDGSLHLWFQPIVSIDDNTILHYEALLRYVDPRGGAIVAPGVFLSAAQRSGKGAKLDRYVLTEAVKNLAKCPELRLGVNISAATLNDKGLTTFLASLLAEYCISPDRLNLEITETEVMSNIGSAINILEEIRGMGVKIALDDFGTGFSSLAYLRNLPVDFLKINGAFVRDLPNNEFNQAILRAVCEIARVRNIKTVAEHVESIEQYDVVAVIRIDYVQGFLMGSPSPWPHTPTNIDDSFAKADAARIDQNEATLDQRVAESNL